MTDKTDKNKDKLKKSTWVQIRLSAEEKQSLTKKAAAHGLSLSAYLRMITLYKKD